MNDLGAGAWSCERSSVDIIMSRIKPPSQLTLSTCIDSGMKAPTDHHQPASSELGRVRTALARLPAFYQRVPALRLRRLSVVDGVPGTGSGLSAGFGTIRSTSDVAFRVSILGERSRRPPPMMFRNPVTGPAATPGCGTA